MFPEDFVEKHVLAWTKPGDIVFDPFCGRGTTVFQSLLMNRSAAGMDVNPVAACVAGAKADPPALIDILQRIDVLEVRFLKRKGRISAPSAFFNACFHRATLQQVLYLREELSWKTNRVDRFIAAIALGALHGESHKSRLCLSNRMPRTISTKPDYSVRWWKERGLLAPNRDAFTILRELAKFRFKIEPAPLKGAVKLGDARKARSRFKKLQGQVRLVVTSPPYLDVTDYAEDQWLRLWFLGGPSVPSPRTFKDDRIKDRDAYWQFLSQVWLGVSPLLAQRSKIVVRIGGRLPREELAAGLKMSMKNGLSGRQFRLVLAPFTSEVKGRQTNTFRPGTAQSFEHDFVYSVT